MVVENKKRAMGVQMRRMLLVILTATIIVLIIYLDLFDEKLLGIPRYAYIIFCGALFLMYYLWAIIRDYNYVFYNDLSSKLVLRYYSLAPLTKRQRSIEIEKHLFLNYEFKKKFFGLRYYLVLFQKMPAGIAKYPPVSLSLLTPKEREVIVKSLEIFKKLT